MLTWVKRFVEMRLLAVALVVAACLWAFFGLADEVMEGETHAIDSALLLLLRNPADPNDPIGGPFLEEVARDMTSFGGIAIVTGVTVFVCGLLLLLGKARTMVFVAASVIGGAMVSTFAKMTFDRPRPDLVSHEVIVSSASFPSGHSMLSAVTYLTLAVLFASTQSRRAVKIYVVATAVLVVIGVGVSRVYLGVHWPTDVAAGWTAGAAWALGCWTIARWLQSRGELEPSPPAQT